MSNRYIVGQADITDFVEDWMHGLDRSDGSLLLQAALAPRDPEAYDLGMAGLMAEISPRVWGEHGSTAELLLYAVLAVYEDHLKTMPRPPWPGVLLHVREAFELARRLGLRACADHLRRGVGHRAGWPVNWHVHQPYTNQPTLADRAATEQRLADADLRDLRAATALDGRDGDPWLSMPLTRRPT